jgi:hypothetical protein
VTTSTAVSPDVLATWDESGIDDEHAAAELEVQRLEAKIARARKAFAAADDDTAEQEQAALIETIRPKLDAAKRRAERRRIRVPAIVAEAAGERAADWWDEASIGDRRAMVNTLMRVTIMAVGQARPRGFDPETVKFEWIGPEK